MNYVNKLFLVLLAFCTAALSAAEKLNEKPLVVLTTSYNNAKWLEKNVTSILSQDYTNYRVVYIDDCSADGTADEVEKLVRTLGHQDRFTVIRNTKRLGSLANIYNGVHLCNDDEIVVSLDGDDWFPNNDVLSIVNKTYQSREIWLTHGTMIEYPNGSKGWSRAIPHRVIKHNKFRKFRCPSHLRTFYAWLFKKIELSDLMYDNWFFPMTWDQAMMFPMIEMAGERHAFIKEVTYVYNVSNPINDNKVDPQLQRDLEAMIRGKKPYARLEKSPLAGG